LTHIIGSTSARVKEERFRRNAAGGRFGGEAGGLSQSYARAGRAVSLGPALDCVGHLKSALEPPENGLFGNKNQQKSTKIATVFDLVLLILNDLMVKFR
jgi:hypothetical protein